MHECDEYWKNENLAEHKENEDFNNEEVVNFNVHGIDAVEGTPKDENIAVKRKKKTNVAGDVCC